MEQRKIGRYQVLEEIASGGQATVYRVWDTQTGQVLALKVMHPHLAKDVSYVERFQREAQLAASINHPNVIRTYEVGQADGSHFMALEFLPLSLHDLIQAQGRMPLDRAVDITHQVALALEAAREKGIVHRDIKPQNILIGPEGTVKVTDFGIGRATDLSTMTRTGAVMGTPHYMSPEQAQGLRVDIRSDIYSLGISLYQMLTGEVPFNADTPWQVIRQHIDSKPTPVRRKRPDVPRAVALVVERCLSKDLDRRYSTPLELAQALDKAMPGAVVARQQPQAHAERFSPPQQAPANAFQADRGAPVRRPNTLMKSWSKARQITRRRRLSRLSSAVTLLIGLAFTATGIVAFPEVRDLINSGSWSSQQEQAVQQPAVPLAPENLAQVSWTTDAAGANTSPAAPILESFNKPVESFTTDYRILELGSNQQRIWVPGSEVTTMVSQVDGVVLSSMPNRFDCMVAVLGEKGTQEIRTTGLSLTEEEKLLLDAKCLVTEPTGNLVVVTTSSETTVPVITSTLDYRIGLTRGGTISGRVTDAETGLPIAYVELEASSVSGDGPNSYTGTDSDGRYTLRGVAPGTYRIRVQAGKQGYIREYYDDRLSRDNADLVAIDGAEAVEGIDIGLKLGATISGRVTDVGTGLPIADVDLSAGLMDGDHVSWTRTDYYGNYTLHGLPDGVIEIFVNGQEYIEERSLVQIIGTDMVTDVRIGLTRGGTISGRVTDAETGLPIANVELEAESAFGDGPNFYTSTSTDSDGRYTLQGIAPGTYRIK
ncbi:MAG: carboxypeptidase regulatory-like domain-containing protein, partial [Dehalococcoidia bacterium]